jgi:predicted amidohydrolase
VIPATSGPAATTTTPVTKTDTFISATINGSRFANNDTIAINGTVGGQAIPSNSGKLYVELKDPHNETVMYDSVNMTTVGNTKAPFSYKFVAGDSLHSSLDRT